MTFRAESCGRGPRRMRRLISLFRIDDRKAGRELMRRLSERRDFGRQPQSPPPTPGSASRSPTRVSRRWVCRRTRSTASPGSSGREWRRARKSLGTPARAAPRTGKSRSGRRRPRRARRALAGRRRLEAALERARKAYRELPGITAIWRQDCHALPTEKEPFGFRDGISHPAIEGSGIPGTNPNETPLKAGEFVLGYPDEMAAPPMTAARGPGSQRNLRRVSQAAPARGRVPPISEGERDQRLKQEELLAAKMMGRWRSGAPLALCPIHDDPGARR